jgi:hypothetical protein
MFFTPFLPAQRRASSFVLFSIACVLLFTAGITGAQNPPPRETKSYERSFSQSKTDIDKALKELQPIMSGRLPVLEGFATPAEQSLEHYQRAYYQCTVQVRVGASQSLVRVRTSLTAWFNDPSATRSGYRVLASNGRIEADILDQLTEVLARQQPAEPAIDVEGKDSSQVAQAAPSGRHATETEGDEKIPPLSAPMPQLPQSGGSFYASLQQGLAAQENSAKKESSANPGTERVPGDIHAALQTEAENLEEILKNQSHPRNLVAVRKSGTPVVETASLNAKTLFLASAHDEFEMLDFNQDWVHVKISGLSRGWIWRNGLEMPGDIPDTAAQSGPVPATEMFHVTREDTSPFPGDWAPLRGKAVKIYSVHTNDDAGSDVSPAMKLEFAKAVLERSYAAAAQKPEQVAGIVLIFDSSDGGMIAAPLTVLQQWKAGTLSDAALWHQCFFDPPETFIATSTSGQ